MIRNLVEKDPDVRSKSDVAKAYSSINIRAKVLEMIQNPKSIIRNEQLSIVVYYGITRERFHSYAVDMDYIQSLDIMSSRNIANAKQGSIDPTENMTIAALLNVILDLMEQNDSALPDNETVNFSANASVNGELYMEHERESKDGSLPNTCPLFKSDEWVNLVRTPSPDTLRAYFTSISVGSIILGNGLDPPATPAGKKRSKSAETSAESKGKNSKSPDTSAKGRGNRQSKVPQPSGHTYHPPFTLTMANMITSLGVEGPASKKPVSPEMAKGATYAERRIEEGHASMPITMSEHIRGVVIAIVMPSAVRGYTNTKRYTWAKYPQKQQAEFAVQYLVESQNFEMASDKWGNPFGKKKNCWESASWYKYFGKEETNTPRAPELRYMAATCMIADLFISCFGGYKTEGRNNAREYVNS